MRCLARAAIIALAVLAVPVFARATATPAIGQPAAPGTWGPDALPYLSGLVCDTAVGSAALVAWTTADGTQPAYAIDAVVGPPAAEFAAARYTRPAIDGQVSELSAGVGGLSAQQVGALSYLLAVHGDSKTNEGVAEVAAAIASIRSDSAVVDSCLTDGVVDEVAVDALWQQALQLVGPYTVRITSAAGKLIMGQRDAVSATVTTASGVPVPGLPVSFALSGADAGLSKVTAVTDSAGQATTALTVATGSTTRAVRIRATASVPGAVAFTSAPGAATLVSAEPAVSVSRARTIAVDTTADPVLTTSLTDAVVLPGDLVSTRLSVTGMRGHNGTAAVTARGPLPFRGAHGCAGYASADWARLRTSPTTTSVVGVGVTADGSYPAGALTLSQPGCYQLTGRVATINAFPNVRRASPAAVLAVVGTQFGLTTGGGGISLPGQRLTADVSVGGVVPGQLSDFTARLLGPVPSNDGSCAHADWDAAAETSSVRTAATSHGAALISAPVRATGCYAFRASSSLQVPGAGSTPLSIGTGGNGAALVLAPSVSLVALSKSSAAPGGQLDASVTVSGSFTHPGTLHLQLLHLPYDWRGCYARDWTHASVVATLEAPAVPTAGDGTYTVPSPKVPSAGCWTVLPALNLDANPNAGVAAKSVTDPMLAFTGVSTDVDAAPRDVSDLAGGSGAWRVVWSAILMCALLLAAFATTVAVAVRSTDG